MAAQPYFQRIAGLQSGLPYLQPRHGYSSGGRSLGGEEVARSGGEEAARPAGEDTGVPPAAPVAERPSLRQHGTPLPAIPVVVTEVVPVTRSSARAPRVSARAAGHAERTGHPHFEHFERPLQRADVWSAALEIPSSEAAVQNPFESSESREEPTSELRPKALARNGVKSQARLQSQPQNETEAQVQLQPQGQSPVSRESKAGSRRPPAADSLVGEITTEGSQAQVQLQPPGLHSEAHVQSPPRRVQSRAQGQSQPSRFQSEPQAPSHVALPVAPDALSRPRPSRSRDGSQPPPETQSHTEPHDEARSERAPEPPSLSPQRSHPRTRSQEQPTGEARVRRALRGTAPRSEVHIGSLEIRVVSPPPAPAPARTVIVTAPAAPSGPLARGFASPIGLRQG